MARKSLWIDIGEGDSDEEAKSLAQGAANQRPNVEILCQYAVDGSAYKVVRVVQQKKGNNPTTIYNEGSFKYVVISKADI